MTENVYSQMLDALSHGLTAEEDREEWRRSPGRMAEYLEAGKWKFAEHLRIIDDAIVDTINNNGRLIIECPVRHGKSIIVSKWTPLYFLERFPDKNVILASYEATFASTWGRSVRNTMTEHKKQLSVKPSRDLTSASGWETSRGGGMVTAGAGSPITGRGAHLFLLDDPIKNYEEASSAIYRQKIWDWWLSTAYTRLEPESAAIITMARWHPDDPVGRIENAELEDEVDQSWKIIRMPALCDDPETDLLGRKEGEALWPERYDEKKLRSVKRAQPSKIWNSLYQQKPRNEEGQIFKREWIEQVKDYPHDAKVCRAWDLAATEVGKAGDPDYTAGVKLAEKGGIYYVLDVVHIRATPLNVERKVASVAAQDGKEVRIYKEEEGGASGKGQSDHYARNVLNGFAFRPVRTGGKSKETRADPVSAAAEAGNLKILEGSWNNTFLDELEEFPEGNHDDQVDALSLAFSQMSTKASASHVPSLSGRVTNQWKVS